MTTDFGIQDAYVATMKGVILGINPEATIVDICHSIEPQNIAQAAFVISTAYDYFPRGTIHIVIVDPGVGSQRRAIILRTSKAFFVAPDNGVLSYIIKHTALKRKPLADERNLPAVKLKRLPPEFQAISLTNPKFWRHPISSTFHGRDVFAPVAAYLSLGVSPEEFGKAITSLLVFPIPRPHVGSNGELVGHVLHIDRFGNLITDIRKEFLPTHKLYVEVGGQRIEGLSTCYEEGSKLLAILGSSGYLEVAMREGSAASLLRAKVSDEVRIKPKE